MAILYLVYLLVIALIIGALFYYVIGVKGPWDRFWPFMVIILLSVLAAGLWVQPVGPNLKGIYWLPPLATGLLMALLLASANQTPPPNKGFEEHLNHLPEQKVVNAALHSFFWIVIALFLILVMIGLAVKFT
jgi:hypothetical protein